MTDRDEIIRCLLENNQAQVSCSFCGEQYTFSESELELIRRKRGPAGMAS